MSRTLSTSRRASARRISYKEGVSDDDDYAKKADGGSDGGFQPSEASASSSSASTSASPSASPSPSPTPPPAARSPAKKQRTPKSKIKGGADEFKWLPASTSAALPSFTALPPQRRHARSYHVPLLLHSPAHNKAGDASRLDNRECVAPRVGSQLLEWFARTAEARGMPWRKAWIDPSAAEWKGKGKERELRAALEKRAYEVWISEIMLQQTRVQTVIAYFNSWISQWPTIQDLAAASPESVLSAWRGLGYYSRATRIHTAAKKVCSDPTMKGLLPETAAELEKNVPGVGRYTAGAISSIVFGRAEAILDGNVIRVLSRQLGLYANGKSRSTMDLLWATAQELVEGVAGFTQTDPRGRSETPSLWNQALMELGSTICTPQPKCGECPIRSTCRAYAEGERLAVHKGQLLKEQALHQLSIPTKGEKELEDIEDLCTMCEDFIGDAEEAQIAEAGDSSMLNGKRQSESDGVASSTSAKKVKKEMQPTLFSHFTKKLSAVPASETPDQPPAPTPVSTQPSVEALNTILSHVKHFPLKTVKSKVREEECLVCVIKRRGSSGKWEWLLEQRPDKGLLASMWEFPTLTLEAREVEESQEGDDADDGDGEQVKGKTGKKQAKKNAAKGMKSNRRKGGEKPSTPKDAPAQDSSTTKARLALSRTFVSDLLSSLDVVTSPDTPLKGTGEVASLVHVFSHLKLKMIVHPYLISCPSSSSSSSTEQGSDGQEWVIDGKKRKWHTQAEVEAQSMGNGMRRCWDAASTFAVTRK